LWQREVAVTNDNLAWSLIIVGSVVFAFGVFLLAKVLSERIALLKAEVDAAKEQIDRAQEERSAIKRELATRHGNVPEAPPPSAP
jgi:F0F1-type ATP synthase membrane subunit b/b'